ncbi:hypothetical protein [Methylobacterium isbiliense]|jgi:hypothetical protein|uniref:Uncharacterized protein n=1 Tax=Methylobacterium isbiliense TaxID=315478 RepID=A0ABQ4SA38_9HYPH|nr:hypothetical protein [Methylobacterium isbiliense]MDN3623859.1 hypothetical protein [Methylobacterium isbiliense]GJD99247.1 hypothetical protein GMJLKIPL_1163 [Methylobacterium isbiliense]
MPEVLRIETGTFAIVEDGLWWPGIYDSAKAALRATGFREGALSQLQQRKNAETAGRPGVITAEDLDALAGAAPGG